MFPSILLLLAQLVTVHVHPFGIVSTRHPNIEVNVHVERDKANRGLSVEVIGDSGYYSISQKELDGEKAGTFHQFKFKDLPEGNYGIYANVTQWKDGKWKTVHEKGENLVIR